MVKRRNKNIKNLCILKKQENESQVSLITQCQCWDFSVSTLYWHPALIVYKRLSCALSPLIIDQPWTAVIPVYYEHWGERYLLCTAAKCFIIGALSFHNNSTMTNKQTMKIKHWPTSPLTNMLVLKFTPRAWLASNQTRCGSLGQWVLLHCPPVLGQQISSHKPRVVAHTLAGGIP